ncbi:unnamed protein product, partial [Mesorhabditis spiculigera]
MTALRYLVCILVLNGSTLALRALTDPNYSCDPKAMAPSASVPTNVNQVRFADIKVIAALGDSLTAANGAGAPHEDPLAIILQYRGLSFHAGGQYSLEEQITVPNILKKFNPKLEGYAIGTGSENVWEVAKLNGGIPGSKSLAGEGQNLKTEAQWMINKIKSHPEIDIENDWKLINIFIGGNDICEWCIDPNTIDTVSAAGYAQGIADAAELIRQYLPRTIISVMSMFNMDNLRSIDNGQFFCQGMHVFECHCEANNVSNALLANISAQYQVAAMGLQTSGKFEHDDFSLVVQPWFQDVRNPPYTPTGEVDHLWFAPDCFHFSAWGHSVVAHHLWNNMVEPVGKKSTYGNLTLTEAHLKCPDTACPYFRTTKNSQDCSQYWTPSTLDI